MKEKVSLYDAWRATGGVFIWAKVGGQYGVYRLELVDPSLPENCAHEKWRHAGKIPCTGPRVCFGCGKHLEEGAGE